MTEASQASFEIVQAYLAFCRLGWHLPVHADKYDVDSTNGEAPLWPRGGCLVQSDGKGSAQDRLDRR